ncbi:hypothetical protein MLD38_029258 [Melastoma candidum]|uniref:Uncharacterized protein n=1 Tax=Melastoma candidum TaxID=119954 RepID=A0ACB9N5P3_9MYRT|nr:hypothetical protein MLD38_029258 [Melastoma candidum]
MALQAGVSTSKVLVLVGAGLTGSIVLRSGRLSELISQLQEILKGVDDVDIASNKFDSAFLAAQIRQLAKEIRELSSSNPITIYNGGSSHAGSFASYLVPATALGVMGYCYMWWKGLSFSDVMFVTKHNMANAVATVSKQLENVSETLAATKRHLSKRLDTLDWKLEEQMDLSNLIANDVSEVNTNLSQIGLEVASIHQIVSGLERKMDLIESNQDSINCGLFSLYPVAKKLEDLSIKQGNPLRVTFEENPIKGLQFLSEANPLKEIEEPETNGKLDNPSMNSTVKAPPVTRRIHRSFPVGISLALDRS